MITEVWAVARALLDRYGLEEAHHYAFQRAHPYRSFGAIGEPAVRLFWRKVQLHLERHQLAMERRLNQRRAQRLRNSIRPLRTDFRS